MAITALPTPPSGSDPASFSTRADAFLGALPTFAAEANAVALAMNLNATSDSSSTSNLIGLGSKTFTVSASKSFLGGMFLIIADTAAPSTNSMYCQVTSYSSTTLVVNVTSIFGSGTKTAWTISQTSPINGVAAIANGGTGAVTAVAAKAALGVGAVDQSVQNVAYTAVLADAGQHLYHTSGTVHAYSIPSNASVAFPIGTALTFVNANGAGVLTISINIDTLRWAGVGTAGSRSLAANGMATALKVSATEWLISGAGLT